MLATREQRRFADAALALQGRVRQFLRDERDLADASRLEANLIELEYIETAREREAIVAEETRARQELNRVLGLPPLANVMLQSEDLTYQPLRLLPGVLEAVMIDRRPDLRAAREAYEQAEQQLRLMLYPPGRVRPASARKKKLPAVTTSSPDFKPSSTSIDSPAAGPSFTVRSTNRLGSPSAGT